MNANHVYCLLCNKDVWLHVLCIRYCIFCQGARATTPWASQRLFRNLWVTSRIQHPCLITSMVTPHKCKATCYHCELCKCHSKAANEYSILYNSNQLIWRQIGQQTSWCTNFFFFSVCSRLSQLCSCLDYRLQHRNRDTGLHPSFFHPSQHSVKVLPCELIWLTYLIFPSHHGNLQ